jgi:hypothetical protein
LEVDNPILAHAQASNGVLGANGILDVCRWTKCIDCRLRNRFRNVGIRSNIYSYRFSRIERGEVGLGWSGEKTSSINVELLSPC